MFVQWNKCII